MTTRDRPSPFNTVFSSFAKEEIYSIQLGLDLPDPLSMNSNRLKLRKVSTVKLGFPATKEDLRLERRRQLRELRLLKDSYADEGIPLFEVETLNDKRSIEADYGAPIEGLRFFNRLLKPSRAFRYEPIVYVGGVPKTHVPQAIKVGHFLKNQGYKIFEGVSPQEYPAHILFTNGGVTGAFNMAVGRLIAHHHAESVKFAHAHGTPMPARPTILLPVPTYGLFLQALDQMEKTGCFRVLKVMRHDNGAVDISSLKRAITHCNEEGSKIIAYYDCTPHNPTGYIRSVEETHIVADILQQQSRLQRDMQDAIYEAHNVLDFSSGNSIFDRIAIIDDMAYEGLEFITQKIPFSFGQVSPEFAQQTLTLKGISKIGFPGARIAAIIGGQDVIAHLSEKMLFNEFTAHSLGVDMITARYSHGGQQELFNKHILSLRKKHKLHAGMLIAFINGLDNTDYLTKKEKEGFIRAYAQHTGLGIATARKLLKTGLPHFYTSPHIESGFFTKINFESLRDASIDAVFDKKPVAYEQSVHSSEGLYWVLKAFGIKALPMSWAGASEQTLEARVTFSLKQNKLFELFDRLLLIHHYFSDPDKPVQPDLFRHKSLQKAKSDAIRAPSRR